MFWPTGMIWIYDIELSITFEIDKKAVILRKNEITFFVS